MLENFCTAFLFFCLFIHDNLNFKLAQLLLCKRYLAGSMRGQMSLEMVAERLSLMTQFITVFETVCPGLSKWRGKMLFQVGRQIVDIT